MVDARALVFENEFDAVFSNAVLHWVKDDPDAPIAGAFRALRIGGRFVGEMGGHACVGAITIAEVRLQEGESLENALRRFKRKVMTKDVIKDVKRHSFYLKPGERRRVKQALAQKSARKKIRKESDQVAPKHQRGALLPNSEPSPISAVGRKSRPTISICVAAAPPTPSRNWQRIESHNRGLVRSALHRAHGLVHMQGGASCRLFMIVVRG